MIRMNKLWDEVEALEQTASLLVECADKHCWALRVVLDELIESVGPSWLAHCIATTKNKAAAAALGRYLRARWPAYAQSVEQLMASTRWTRESNNMTKDFGED